MNASGPQNETGIQPDTVGKTEIPSYSFSLKTELILPADGRQVCQIVAVEGALRANGMEVHTFAGANISSPYIPRIVLLLCSWRQSAEVEFKIGKLAAWEKLGDLLRGTTEAGWLKDCFGSRRNLTLLLKRSKGLLHVDSAFDKSNVEVVVQKPTGSGQSVTLSNEDAIKELKSIVGLSTDQELASDHKDFIAGVVEELVGVTLNERDTRLVGQCIWLSHLSRLERVINQFLAGERSLLGTLVDETARQGGGFDRETVSGYYAELNVVIKRIQAEFSDEAIRLDFDIKEFTNELRAVQGILDELESLVPCSSCGPVSDAKKRLLSDEKFNELHVAAEKSRKRIKEIKPRLSKVIRGFRGHVERLVKEGGL